MRELLAKLWIRLIWRRGIYGKYIPCISKWHEFSQPVTITGCRDRHVRIKRTCEKCGTSRVYTPSYNHYFYKQP